MIFAIGRSRRSYVQRASYPRRSASWATRLMFCTDASAPDVGSAIPSSTIHSSPASRLVAGGGSLGGAETFEHQAQVLLGGRPAGVAGLPVDAVGLMGRCHHSAVVDMLAHARPEGELPIGRLHKVLHLADV